MFLIGDKRELVMVLEKDGVYHLACFGRKRHYRKDGTCKHTDAVLERMRPEVQACSKVEPFGGRAAEK